jgi:hypothetical protein
MAMDGRDRPLVLLVGDCLQPTRGVAVILKRAQVRDCLKSSLQYYPGESSHCYRACLGYLFFLRESNANDRWLFTTIHRPVANSVQLHFL